VGTKIGAGGMVGGIAGGRVIAGARVGHPLWWTLQHHALFSAPQEDSAPIAQLKGSTGPVGRACVGGAVGGGVGGGVGGVVTKGVGGAVGFDVGNTVVSMGHPLPVALQQYSIFAWGHIVCQLLKPSSQSNGNVVVSIKLDKSHNRHGMRQRRSQHEPRAQV